MCLPTAWPARFREGLKDLEVLEGGAATLRCKLSSVVAPVEWRRGEEVLRPGPKYSLHQEGTVLELVVRDLRPQDSGPYSCCFGDQRTMATLTVKGKQPRLPAHKPLSSLWEDENGILSLSVLLQPHLLSS